MKKTVSFKLFFTVMWRGVCQAVNFIGKIFGYKGEDSYAKVVWRIIMGCVATIMLIITSMLLYGFVNEIVLDKWVYSFRCVSKAEITHQEHISNHLVFQKIGNDNSGRLFNTNTEEILLEDIDWIVVSKDNDSLAVFAQDNRRGYLNRFTGEVAITPVFTKAWVFSEGLAAVEHNGTLKFINHKGDFVIDKGYEVHYDGFNYLFKSGYCMIRDKVDGRFGFIDTSGNWVIEPIFDYIHYQNDFIRVTVGNKRGLYSVDLRELLPIEYERITIDSDDNTILARKKDDTAVLYDMELNVLEDFVIAEISPLKYDTKVQYFTNEDGEEVCEKIYALTNCNMYMVGENYYECHYGLISKNGIRLTTPLYTSIEAVAPNRYLCLPHGVVLDDKGNVVE